jgi:hypothetical protein
MNTIPLTTTKIMNNSKVAYSRIIARPEDS